MTDLRFSDMQQSWIICKVVFGSYRDANGFGEAMRILH